MQAAEKFKATPDSTLSQPASSVAAPIQEESDEEEVNLSNLPSNN